MNLTKEILRSSELPLSFSKFVFCFNLKNENEVWNLPTREIETFNKKSYTVGVWKIKQLKQ